MIFVQKEGFIDIKICFPCNLYHIKAYSLFDIEPLEYTVSNNNEAEIEVTYHSKTDNRELKIHLKVEKNGAIEYITIPLVKLSSPNVDSFIPFPLFKIEIPNSALKDFPNKKILHSNSRKYTDFEIEYNHKIVEYYLLNNGSKLLNNGLLWFSEI